jgi:hypothetical protein
MIECKKLCNSGILVSLSSFLDSHYYKELIFYQSINFSFSCYLLVLDSRLNSAYFVRKSIPKILTFLNAFGKFGFRGYGFER